MNNLPKINQKVIFDINSEMKNLIKTGKMMEWINDIMENLKQSNPILFQYLRVQSMRFSLGITMAQGDANAIAMSHLISNIVLLRIIDKCVGYKEIPKEIDKITEQLLGDWLPEDLDFGGQNETKK